MSKIFRSSSAENIPATSAAPIAKKIPFRFNYPLLLSYPDAIVSEEEYYRVLDEYLDNMLISHPDRLEWEFGAKNDVTIFMELTAGYS